MLVPEHPLKPYCDPKFLPPPFTGAGKKALLFRAAERGLCSQGQLSCISSDKALYLSCLFAWWGWFLCSCAHPFEVLRRRSVFQRVECSTKREQMPGELWRCPWLTAGKVGWGVGVFGWLALFGCPLGILGGWLVWLLAFCFVFPPSCNNVWSAGTACAALWWDSWRADFSTGGSERAFGTAQRESRLPCPRQEGCFNQSMP